MTGARGQPKAITTGNQPRAIRATSELEHYGTFLLDRYVPPLRMFSTFTRAELDRLTDTLQWPRGSLWMLSEGWELRVNFAADRLKERYAHGREDQQENTGGR